MTPDEQDVGTLKLLRHGQVEIYQGDFFDLTAQILGSVDVIYDRAALVALPPDMRIAYTRHLTKISDMAQQLLITLDYDPSKAGGPPHAVPGSEVAEHYGAIYDIKLLQDQSTSGPLAQRISGRELVWQLDPKP